VEAETNNKMLEKLTAFGYSRHERLGKGKARGPNIH